MRFIDSITITFHHQLICHLDHHPKKATDLDLDLDLDLAHIVETALSDRYRSQYFPTPGSHTVTLINFLHAF